MFHEIRKERSLRLLRVPAIQSWLKPELRERRPLEPAQALRRPRGKPKCAV
jgi:hypothetical protein